MRLALLLAAAALVACGSDSNGDAAGIATQPVAGESGMAETSTSGTAEPSTSGTRITVRGSRFGRMLWGPGRQAIYIFENDKPSRSRCYGACAEAWPPVFTDGKPVAGRGVRPGLLGTTKRRDGRRQVTYDGQPLYYYAHEGPNEVLCHNVFLNGGYWWVVGPNGKRRP